MSSSEEELQRMLNLALRREQSKAMAIQRFSAIVVNNPFAEWDTLIEAAIVEGKTTLSSDVHSAFENQMRQSLANYKEVYRDMQRVAAQSKSKS